MKGVIYLNRSYSDMWPLYCTTIGGSSGDVIHPYK